MNTNFNTVVPKEFHRLLEQVGVQPDGEIRFVPLTGGVASDVWLLESAGKQYCLKRALSKLKVEQDWQVNVKRSEFEVLWFRTVAKLCGNLQGNQSRIVPTILASDEQVHAFVMDYFEPQKFPVWKQELAKGNINSDAAVQLAEALGEIHQLSARLPELAKCFDNHEGFYQIRIEPYFLATAKKHPEQAGVIESLAKNLASTRIALVHGDISPKNILMGNAAERKESEVKAFPIILDAECAVYGDPAFDIAFLLNHLLLKYFMVFDKGAEKLTALHECFTKVFASYLIKVDWEDKSIFEKRVLNYLAVFLLARIDGKSPIEYIHNESDKNFVRNFAIELLNNKHITSQAVSKLWHKKFNQFKAKL